MHRLDSLVVFLLFQCSEFLFQFQLASRRPDFARRLCRAHVNKPTSRKIDRRNFFFFQDENQRFSSNTPRRRTSSIDSNEIFPTARRDRWPRFIPNRWSIGRVFGTRKKVFISGKKRPKRFHRRPTFERKGRLTKVTKVEHRVETKRLDCGTSAPLAT